MTMILPTIHLRAWQPLGFTLFLLPLVLCGQGQINALWPQFPSPDLVIHRLSDPCNPAGPTTSVEGSGYSAELWYSRVAHAIESDLILLPGSQRALGRNGQILIGNLAPLNGLYGGDLISLQVRVWDNLRGTIQSWSQVLQDPEIARGVSKVVDEYELSGVGRNGEPYVGSGSIQVLRGPMTVAAVCPEPSSSLLIGLSLGALTLFFRTKRSRG